MADASIAQLTAITTAVTADLLVIVDVSDTTADAAGTTKKMTLSVLSAGINSLIGYIYLADVKASTTAGGTFTSGAWQTRTLNTEWADTGGHCTLASNQFTLLAGTYRIRARAPACLVNGHQARLQNITDGATVFIGSNAYADATYVGHTDSWVAGRFTISATKTFELQHRCSSTRATNGFGAPTSWGDEVYSEVELIREPG